MDGTKNASLATLNLFLLIGVISSRRQRRDVRHAMLNELPLRITNRQDALLADAISPR
ncbi:MAG: hypothetical protein U0V48_11660 [Anaerolineales bacterium]